MLLILAAEPQKTLFRLTYFCGFWRIFILAPQMDHIFVSSH